MIARTGIDQLHRDPHRIARTLNAALEDCCNVKTAAYLPEIDVLSSELERRCPSRHTKIRELGEGVQNLLADAVTEILAGRVVAQVREREHCDGSGKRAAPAGRPFCTCVSAARSEQHPETNQDPKPERQRRQGYTAAGC